MGRIKEISRKSVHTRKRNPVVYLICEGSETEIRYWQADSRKTDRTITIPAVRCCGLHRFTTHFRPHQAENLQSHPNHSAQTALDENAR